jgi:hypothetical protein
MRHSGAMHLAPITKSIPAKWAAADQAGGRVAGIGAQGHLRDPSGSAVIPDSAVSVGSGVPIRTRSYPLMPACPLTAAQFRSYPAHQIGVLSRDDRDVASVITAGQWHTYGHLKDRVTPLHARSEESAKTALRER